MATPEGFTPVPAAELVPDDVVYVELGCGLRKFTVTAPLQETDCGMVLTVKGTDGYERCFDSYIGFYRRAPQRKEVPGREED